MQRQCSVAEGGQVLHVNTEGPHPSPCIYFAVWPWGNFLTSDPHSSPKIWAYEYVFHLIILRFKWDYQYKAYNHVLKASFGQQISVLKKRPYVV